MKNICLIDPAFPHNVGQVLRTASIFATDRVYMTGTRVPLEGDGKKYRLPREERLRSLYGEIIPSKRPFDENRGLTPVAVELVPGAENLIEFEHPENALYVFGPEDGTLSRSVLGQCHRFIQIPGQSCLNLANAVSVVLYDRHAKRVHAGLEPSLSLQETEVRL